jgi:hypothetical protein
MRVDKPKLFRLLGYEPHAGQVAIHRSTASSRIVACGVRWGKTLAAAMEGLAAALAPSERSIGWVVGPTYDLADRVFREIELIAARHLRHRIVALKEHDRRIILRNMAGGLSEIRCKSSDNPVSLLGEGLDWVIVDEAARMRPHIWEAHLSQRLLDRKGWALLISTPRGKGYFHDLFLRGQGRDPHYESWNYPSSTNPHLDAAQIEAERERVPEAVFRQEYLAEFMEGSGAVFRNVRENATGEWKAPVNGEYYAAGLDLARTTDFTVLVIMSREKEVVFVDRFNRLDWNLQVARIRADVERYNSARVHVDSTGVGEPIFESLRQANIWAEAYPFSQKSKAALVNNLALMLEKRQIVLPRPELWPVGIDELEAFQYSILETGTVRAEAPYGMHDDCVMALALAAWSANQLFGRRFLVEWI